ncbi:MAG: hypothetical protein LBE20_05000 [Deltaproteobacteria bacterium]|jgi:hypothetical protein|nr:hypothetical protein [Deltaproteobacteria bacterium]
MFKYLYITSKRRSDVHRFYRQLYLEHEKIWNNFKEFDNPSKNSAEKFIDSFEETFVDIQKNNFDFNRPIHIWENGDIANGAHRLAICAALQKDISVKLVTSPIYQWDWSYFQQRGLQKSSSDIIALEYVKLNPNAYIVCLFPSMPMQYDDYVIRILNQYGYVYYKKEFTLSVNGCINIHKISYGKEDWIDSYDNNFANLQRRALKTTGGQQEGTMRSFVFVCDNLEKVKEAKKQIRAILNIGNYPVHINDTKEEAIELAQTFFNDNSLYMLNKLPFNQRMDRIDYLVNEFKQYIFKNGYNADDLCAMGSTPMGVFGLRKNNDFDFLHLDQDIVKPDNPIFSQHTSELSYYPVSLSEIVINPANHFFYKGVKFITLDLLKEMKKIRNQQKDMNDVRIIDEFVMGNTYYCLPFSKIPETTTKHLF